MSTLMSLPDDLKMVILGRVPAKTLLCCKCVAKPLLKFISNNSFIKLQIKYANEHAHPMIIINKHYNGLSIIGNVDGNGFRDAKQMNLPLLVQRNDCFLWGTCNGIICMSTDVDGVYCIVLWNPVTNKCVKLPEIPGTSKEPEEDGSSYYKVLGFGYLAVSEEYKIVRVVDNGSTQCEIMVYTLGNKCSYWKKVVPGCPKFIGSEISYAQTLNGSVHWMCVDVEKKRIGSIASFDLMSDQVREFELPDNFEDKKSEVVMLGMIEGCLAIYDYNEALNIDVWIMKDYGVKESWTKIISIDDPPLFKSLQPLFVNGEVLLGVTMNGVVIYDRTHNNAAISNVRGIVRAFAYEWFTYVETLATLGSTSNGSLVKKRVREKLVERGKPKQKICI